jgi:hypothetical protein
MSTQLPNGTVVPFGLLSPNGSQTAVAAFNRSYKNTGIKAGLVQKSYAPTDSENQNGLCTEYDVLTIEQDENKGTTSILYKNCLSTQGFGGIADYLEYTLRPLTMQTSKGFPTFSNQDGAIVLIQCLNNIGDKAIVVGTLIHPDRTTNVTSNDPQLYGEYNGVNVKVNTDGSVYLTFNGATDSQGAPTDSTQGVTAIQIETDGSFQAMNDQITFRMDRTQKNASLTASQDINLTASGKMNIVATGDCNITTQGKANITSTSDTVINASGDCNITASGNVAIKGTQINLNNPEGMVLTTVTDQVVDYITGIPTVGVPTVLAG